MGHLGGMTSKISRALHNVREQLRTGKTRGQHPRDLLLEEVAALEQKRTSLATEARETARKRSADRIASHTTREAHRVIEAVERAGASASSYFEAIGGAGSSTDLRLQGHALIGRANVRAKAEKAAQREIEKKAKASEKKAKAAEEKCAEAARGGKRKGEASVKAVPCVKRQVEGFRDIRIYTSQSGVTKATPEPLR